MPILGTVASSITGNIVNNFMTVYSSSTQTLTGLRNAIASNGDFYIAMSGNGSQLVGGSRLVSAGNSLTWIRNGDIGQYSGYNGVAITSDGNPVFAGYNNSPGSRRSGRMKLNATTGATEWHYYYDVQGYGNACTVDSSGQIWSAQQTGGGAGVLRTNTDGLSPTFYQVNNQTYCTNAQALSDGYIYSLTTDGAGENYRVNVQKWDTSGNLQWQKRFNTAYSTDGNVALDNSGNVYIATYAADSGTSGGRALVFKINSAGSSLLGQFKLDTNTSNFEGFSNIVHDPTNNVFYIVGSSAGKGLIVKIDTGLNILWQRTLTGVDDLSGVSLVNANNIFVTGTTNAKVFAAKLKADGSGTGTYTILSQTITYAASSLTYGSDGYSMSTATNGTSTSNPARTTVSQSLSTPTTSIARQAI
jgi:hypothetical protein